MGSAICDMAERIRYPRGRRLYYARCCGKRRWASHTYIKECYDASYVFCRPGHGCQAPKRSRKKRYREFLEMLTTHERREVSGLARAQKGGEK